MAPALLVRSQRPITGPKVKSERGKLPCVVLVDDDELVLSTLRALLELDGGFQVLEFTDSLRAIEELGRLPVDIVISDYLMPGMNGVDVLKKARSLQPEAMRILLTGFADKQNAIRALNEAGIYQYLEKPWDNDQLLMVLQNALREKGLRQQLAEKIRTLDRLIVQHDELADRQQRLEQDLEMAARVQRSLLPDCFPEIPGPADRQLLPSLRGHWGRLLRFHPAGRANLDTCLRRQWSRNSGGSGQHADESDLSGLRHERGRSCSVAHRDECPIEEISS